MVSRAERRAGAPFLLLSGQVQNKTLGHRGRKGRAALSMPSSWAVGDGVVYRSTASPDSCTPGSLATCVSTTSRLAARRSMVCVE